MHDSSLADYRITSTEQSACIATASEILPSKNRLIPRRPVRADHNEICTPSAGFIRDDFLRAGQENGNRSLCLQTDVNQNLFRSDDRRL